MRRVRGRGTLPQQESKRQPDALPATASPRLHLPAPPSQSSPSDLLTCRDESRGQDEQAAARGGRSASVGHEAGRATGVADAQRTGGNSSASVACGTPAAPKPEGVGSEGMGGGSTHPPRRAPTVAGGATPSFDLWQICPSPTESPSRTVGEMVTVPPGAAVTPPPLFGEGARRPPSGTAKNRRDATQFLLAALERAVPLRPKPYSDDTLTQGLTLAALNSWMTRLLVSARVAMVVFPAIAAVAYAGRYAHPAVVFCAVGIAFVGAGFDLVGLRRGMDLTRGMLLPADLAISVSCSLVALTGAGATGRVHGLDGFAPYLMILAALAGVAYQLTWPAFAITAVAGATWAVLPIGRGWLLVNDEGGFLLWLVAGAAIAGAMRALATRLDEAREVAVAAERARERAEAGRLVHQNVLPLLERLSEGETLPTDPLRAGKAVEITRQALLGDHRERGIAAGEAEVRVALQRLVMEAREDGLVCRVEEIIQGVPPTAVTEMALGVLDALRLNSVKAGATRVDIAWRCDSTLLRASLTDNGRGFDPSQAAWSAHTRHLVAGAAALGLRIRVESEPGAGARWHLSWLREGPG